MKQKLFLTSVIAILCSANAWASLHKGHCTLFPGMEEDVLDRFVEERNELFAAAEAETGGAYNDDATGRYVYYHYDGGVCEDIYADCPANYDNTATGLTSIEECCLNGYDSSTGLCNEGASAFPSNGLMQENKTYANAATSTNMDGVYSGTVNAVAEYDLINYVLSAGQYLPKDSETVTTCPAGSYCSGIGSVQYSATANQGIESCPTIGGADFTSASGSSAVTSCYQENTAMSTATLNPFTTANLNTSKNGDGYINGVKYASATTAARRYATSATTAGDWAALDESDLAITGLACENGYHYKEGTTGLNVDASIGGIDFGWQNSSIRESEQHTYNTEKYDITEDQTWAVEFNYGVIRGKALCSTTNGTEYGTGTPDEGGTGWRDNCWCQIDGYTPVGGSKQSLSGAWVFTHSSPHCADNCALICTNSLQKVDVFRAAMFDSVNTPAMCEANTITINWSNADEEDISANNAGTATYGSDVRTPVKAETIKGKTFKGWKFSKPTTTQL